MAMIVRLENFLSQDQLERFRGELTQAGEAWKDGKRTALGSARQVKENRQLDRGSPLAKSLGSEVVTALRTDRRFTDAALPANMSRVVFARYGVGDTYGPHLDLPHMNGAQGGQVRTDLALTIFLQDPADYDGGELRFFSDYGPQTIKGSAGELVLYPASTVHEVMPVSRGERLVAIAWVQSLVPDGAKRTLLHDLLLAAQGLEAKTPRPPEAQRVRKSYYNLLRMWSQP